jgi:hypothetical protein
VVAGPGQARPPAPWQGREKRASARLLCNRTARVYQEGCEEFVTVRDLSTHGAGLHLERALPAGALLVVESLSPGAKTLLARVVRVESDGRGWLHGCSLLVGLSDEELRGWRAERPAVSAGAEAEAATDPAAIP